MRYYLNMYSSVILFFKLLILQIILLTLFISDIFSMGAYVWRDFDVDAMNFVLDLGKKILCVTVSLAGNFTLRLYDERTSGITIVLSFCLTRFHAKRYQQETS